MGRPPRRSSTTRHGPRSSSSTAARTRLSRPLTWGRPGSPVASRRGRSTTTCLRRTGAALPLCRDQHGLVCPCGPHSRSPAPAPSAWSPAHLLQCHFQPFNDGLEAGYLLVVGATPVLRERLVQPS